LKEKKKEEEPRIPIKIVPARRLEEEQMREMQYSLDQVNSAVSELREYSEDIKIRPDEATIEYVNQYAEKVGETLEKMKKSLTPEFRERLENEFVLINNTIKAAKEAGKEGRLGRAVHLLVEATDQVKALRKVAALEAQLHTSSVLENVELEGVEPENVRPRIYSALEASVLDVGTENAARSRYMLKVGALLAENKDIYSIDDPLVSQEASAAAASLVERADQAEKGLAYSPALEAQDNKSIEKFEANLTLIAKQFRDMNIGVFKTWRKELEALVDMQTSDQVREHVRNLMRQLSNAIKRLEKGQTLGHSEITRLTTSYLMTTGREMPKSREERFDELDAVAAELRGKRKKVKEDTAQWFGQLAINAINEEQRNRAALAISLGLIQQAARELNRDAMDYLSNYLEMRNILTKKREPSPAMLSMFSTQLEAASMLIEAERYESLRKGKAAPKRERVKKAAAVARERLADGDGEGSRRILNMLAYYMDQLEQNKWKSWEGIELIEQALDEEIKGKDGSRLFDSGLVFYNVSEELDNFKKATKDWRKGMAPQKKTIEKMFAYARKAAKRGDVESAGKALTMLGMYVDSAERLAERKGRVVLKVADEDTAYLSGMEKAMASMAAGKAAFEDTFTESFKLSQTAYVGGEADRLENLAKKREIGQETVLNALDAARRRAGDGDFVGANTLLQNVRDYYGEAQKTIKRKGKVIQKAKKEGWRYALLTKGYEEEPRMGIRPYKGIPRGYRQGGEQILQAMELEMRAKTHDEHFAAAQMFDQGTKRMANTQLLLADYERLRDVYYGKESLAPGVKAGKLPLGRTKEDGTMEIQGEIDLETIRSYEAENVNDTVTTRGRAKPLAERFEDLRAAALNGQARRFDRLNARFWNRLSIVTGRAERRRAVTEARGMLRQGQQSLMDSYRTYVTQVYAGGDYDKGEKIWTELTEQVNRQRPPKYVTEERVMPTTGRRVRVQVFVGPTLKEIHEALVANYGEKDSAEFRRMEGLVQYSGYMGELLKDMEGIENTEADINFHHISPFLEFAQKESRTALAYDFVSQQLSMFKEYRRVLGGRVSAMAEINFDEAIPHLEKTRNLLMQGKLDDAEKAFREAVYWQVGALANYDAVNASSPFTKSGRESYARGLSIIGRLMKGDKSVWTKEPDWSRYNNYSKMQETIFSSIIKGKGSREELETAMKGARIIEVSVFGTPADEASQSLTSYVDDQTEIRKLVEAGKIEQANARLAELQETVSDWRLLGQVGLTAAGLAAILCGHPHVGGAIFVTMGIDNLITEYRMTGTTSAMSWIMLGGIVASMGLAGWAGMLRTSALAAEGAGATSRAAMLTRIATGVNYANMGIGVGFSVYMGYHAIDAFKEGRNKEGLFLTFLAAFPWAHRYGPKVPAIMRAKISRLRGRVGARAQLESVVEEVRVPEVAESQFEMEPSKAASRTAAERYRSPEGLFDLLRRLRSGDVKVRTNAEGELNTLPREMAEVIAGLRNAKIGNVTHLELRGALEKGEMTGHARGLLEEAISQMELGPRPEPTPPKGPRGGAPIPRGEVESAGLLHGGMLRNLVRGLMIPDTAVAGETAAARAAMVERSSARATLERIRTEAPEVADVIDGMLKNPTIREYVATGEANQLAHRMWGQAESQIRNALPPETIAAEQKMAVGYYEELSVVGREVPKAGEAAEGPQMVKGMPEVRAMAEGTKGPSPPKTEAPAEPQRVIMEKAPGMLRRGAGRVSRAVRETRPVRSVEEALEGRREQIAEREALEKAPEPPSLEGTLDQATGAFKNTLDLAGDPALIEARLTEVRAKVQGLEAKTQRLIAEEAPARQIRKATEQLNAAREGAVQLENTLRSAQKNVVEILRALDSYTQEGGGRAPAQLARQLYARPNIRAQLERMAANEGLRGRIGKGSVTRLITRLETGIARGAKRAKIPVEEYRESLSGREITPLDTEVALKAIEAQRGKVVLERAEQMLGIRFTSAERAVVIARLESGETPVYGPEAVYAESRAVRLRLGRGVEELPTENNPVVESMKKRLGQRTSAGGNMDAALRELMGDQPQIENAIKKAYGEEAAKTYRDALLREAPEVREGAVAEAEIAESARMNREALDEMLNAMRKEGTPMPEMLKAVESFVNKARAPELVSDFSAAGSLNPRTAHLNELADAEAGTYAQDTRAMLPTIKGWVRNFGKFIWEWEPVTNWGGRTFVRSLIDTVKTGSPRPLLVNSPKFIPQALVYWMVFGDYGQDNIWKPLYEKMTGARTIREGIAIAKRDFNIEISETNAEWIMGGRSSEQAELVRDIRDEFEDLKEDIIEASPSISPFADEVGDILLGRARRPFGQIIMNAEEAIIREVSAAEFSKGQEQKINAIFEEALDQITEQFGGEGKGQLNAAMIGEIKKLLESSRDDIIEEFKDHLTGVQVKGNGTRFFTHIPTTFPKGRALKPHAEKRMDEYMKNTEILIDPRRLNEVLEDGRLMDEDLQEINGLMEDVRTKTGEDKAEARKELAEIFKKHKITVPAVLETLEGKRKTKEYADVVDAVQALLDQERKKALDITDMFDMRIEDWRSRRIAVYFRDALAEAFVIDTSIMPEPQTRMRMEEKERAKTEKRGYAAMDFLSAHPKVFSFLWKGVQEGYIPSVYVDNVIDNLKKQELEGLDLEKHLRSAGLYIAVRRPDGTEVGVLHEKNSFLGLLDMRAAAQPKFIPVMEKILGEYKNDNDALLAFSGFSLEKVTVDKDKATVTGGEAIYGDAAKLARLIIDDPANAAEKAREQGFVGPAVLGDMEPGLYDPANAYLISFVMDRSRGDEMGLLRWLEDRRDNIAGHVLEILKEAEKSATCPGAGRYGAIYDPNKPGRGYFDRKALDWPWWVGPTPMQELEMKERRSRGTKEKEPSWEEEFEARYVRAAGFPVVPRRVEGGAEEEAEAEAEAVAVTLSPEAQAFWVDWLDKEMTKPGPAGGLNSRLTGTIDMMLEDERDAKAFQDAYGEDVTDKNSDARKRAETEIREHLYRFFKDASDLNTEKKDTRDRNRRALGVRKRRGELDWKTIEINVVEGAINAERSGSTSSIRNFMRKEIMKMLSREAKRREKNRGE